MYKYISNELPQFFENGMLRFTQPGQFNDPFELLPRYVDFMGENTKQYILDNIEVLVKEIPQNEPWYIKLIPMSIKVFAIRLLLTSNHKRVKKVTDEIDAFGLSVANGQYRDIIDQSYGILCLSAKEDSLLMRSHYGNSHKGYVIEFDTSHKFFNQVIPNKKTGGVLDYAGTPLKVTYTKRRKTILFWQKAMSEVFLTKGSDWEYEQEYRMVLPLETSTEVVNGNIHLFHIPFDAVKSIIFGAKCEDEFIQNSIAKIHHWDSKHIDFQLFQFNLSDNDFELVRKKI